MNTITKVIPTQIQFDDENLVLIDYKRYFTKQLEQGILIKEIDLPKRDILKKWYKNITHLEELKNELDNSHVREIIIHHPPHLHLDIKGHLCPITLKEFNYDNFILSIKWLTLSHNMMWNLTSPYISFGIILNNSPLRMTLLHPSLTPENKYPKVFIRKLQMTPLHFNDFDLTSPEQELFKHFIQKKMNLIIAGATNSGKTTFTQTLMSLIPKEEHAIILEDTHELSIPSPYFTHLLAKKDYEINSSPSLKDFMAISLRLRPDRIILGEIRSNEVIPFLLGLNTGHKGLISTIHANSAEDALERLCLLFTFYHEGVEWDIPSLKKLISKNLDYIVFMESKRIKKIIHLKDEISSS